MQNDDVISSTSKIGVDVNELTVCPSFSTYYSDRQAAAARAVSEVLATRSSSQQPKSELDEDEDDEDEFEFSILCNDSFPDGDIGQIFPIFDRNLVGEATKVVAASVSLKKLFIGEDVEKNVETDWESEADELESAEPGTYCVWKPKTSSLETRTLSPARCKKSKSTGSCSKRWKLRDLLLRRSNSDGKDSFVYLTPTSSNADEAVNSGSSIKVVKSGNRRGSGENGSIIYKSAHEMFYVEKRAVKEEDRKRSYLPYRKGLVGFGFFPNGYGRP